MMVKKKRAKGQAAVQVAVQLVLCRRKLDSTVEESDDV